MDAEHRSARVSSQVVDELMTRVDFSRLDDSHEIHIYRMCAEAIARVDEPDDELASTLSAELMATRGFFGLLQQDGVSDVLVNGPDLIYVERDGVLSRSDVTFPSELMLRKVALWLSARVGRPVSEARPMIDARLPDGSRLNVVIPPVALDGTLLSVRRFRHTGLDLEGLARIATIPQGLQPLLRGMVAARLNILVSGGTGAGKTTLLNALSEAIPQTERVVTIEDSAELRLRQDHVVRLETRLEDIDGRGAITSRDLVRNALRMRPDRILVGEVRGTECVDMLQAMNTGHEGSMSTVHANSPRDALDRLETMFSMSGLRMDQLLVRGQLARALHAILHVRRMPDGRRVLSHVCEVGQLQGGVIPLQDVMRYEGTAPGQPAGFRSTGLRPSFADRIEEAGSPIPVETWRLQQALS